ncbi:MAG: hypothetical protein WD981_00180 [Gaiellaceae bacterium]
MILGTAFLLAFAGGLAGLYSFRSGLVTETGIRERLRRLRIGVSAMAIVAWATVITGTWIVYPWYREATPDSPRSILLADPSTETWHTFGMEWKEHIAWTSPMLATAAAFLVLYYGAGLVANRTLRMLTIVLFVGGFVTAGIAGLLGALITKAAPVA